MKKTISPLDYSGRNAYNLLHRYAVRYIPMFFSYTLVILLLVGLILGGLILRARKA